MVSSSNRLKFRIEKTSGYAGAGKIQHRGREVNTPAFMPVGTQAGVKTLASWEVEELGARMLISNTYHLWLRPGAELIAEAGGIHQFMGWKHLVATDSGGFQAFSLAKLTKLSDDGFAFSSHIDGARKFLSPEESMRVQGLLDSDIALQLDVCAPAGSSRDELERALKLTTAWAERCLAAKSEKQALYGINQGGVHTDLRLRHLNELQSMSVDGLDLDGIALGGFSVGEPPEEMHRGLRELRHALDSSRPHYLMGVGTPLDILIAIACGIDMFDCVMPSRNARNGQVFIWEADPLLGRKFRKVVIRNAQYRDDSSVLEEGCDCMACGNGVTRTYLRHLFIAGEILAHRLLTAHNLRFYQRLVAEARQAILESRYDDYLTECLTQLGYAGGVEDFKASRG